jgi:hypothetical protein
MKITSFKMSRHFIASLFITVTGFSLVFSSCQKSSIHKEPKSASVYSSEVIDKWMTMQLRLMRNATGIPNQAFSRHFAYSGIAAFESLRPGLTRGKKWNDKWNGLNGLPRFQPSTTFYFPANVNAALAAINKSMFPNANAADKAAIDSLEEALKNKFLLTENASLINASAEFGKSVASAIFNWAEIDGYKMASAPYTVQVGDGLWKPTAPSFASPSTPYWGNNRTVVKESLANTSVNGLPVYSAETGSAFYNMVRQVYDASLVLIDDQKAMALYWRDVPGVTSPGHWVSILQQIMQQKTTSLEKAALAYALTGAALNDALIRCFQLKYQHLAVRPVTYIRDIMGESSWSSFIGTPPHPEYVSNHSALSVASAAVLEELFGRNQPFTDHTYDYMGMAPRNYPSYMAIGLEAGLSRFYGGIHYRQSIDDGTTVGKKIAENILSKQDYNY